MNCLKTLLWVTMVVGMAMYTEKVGAKEPRTRQKKTRGYRAGWLNPVEMYESKKLFTAQDARRGSIEKFEDLPPIEWYENTLWTYENRKDIEKQVYKLDDLRAWDHYFANITELSREMHDFYIIDPNDGRYQIKN